MKTAQILDFAPLLNHFAVLEQEDISAEELRAECDNLPAPRTASEIMRDELELTHPIFA